MESNVHRSYYVGQDHDVPASIHGPTKANNGRIRCGRVGSISWIEELDNIHILPTCPMGNDESSYVEDSVPFEPRPYACLFFCRGDKLKVILGDEEFRRITNQELENLVPIDRAKEYGTCQALTVMGSPFSTDLGASIETRLMQRDLLATLYSRGWMLVMASNLTRKDDVTSWFFRKATVEYPRQEIVVIGLKDDHKMHIIAPDGITERVVQTCQEHFDVREASQAAPGVTKVKLGAAPWNSTGEMKWSGRRLLLRITMTLERSGYCYYGSGDISGSAETLFFMRGQDVMAHESHYMMMTLDDVHKLRLMDASPAVVIAVRRIISRFWGLGLKNDGEYLDGYEFKLVGSPWCSTREMAVDARILLIKIFDELSRLGFKVVATLGMSRKLTDKSAFILRSVGQQEFQANPLVHACVGCMDEGKIQLINFPQRSMGLARSAIFENWPAGIRGENVKYVPSCYQIKLIGAPWASAVGGLSVDCRVMMLAVLAALESDGWRIVSSADVSARYHDYYDEYNHQRERYPLDVDSWFFCRPETGNPELGTSAGFSGNVPSAPVLAEDSNTSPPPSYFDLSSDAEPPSYDK